MSKTTLITGASRGLGFQIARGLLAAGHRVVATARSTDGLADKLAHELAGGDRLHVVALDVTDAASVSAAVEAAVARLGRIDVLVNNAGHAQLGHFEMTRDADVRRQFEVNLFGPMAVTRAVLPHMRERRAGLLVTISSMSGLVSSAGGSVYSASKFALEGWIEGLAHEVEPLGIRSLLVEPGLLRTAFLDPSTARLGDVEVADYAEAAAQFRAFIAGANGAQPNDPAVLAAHVARLIGEAAPPARFVFGDDALQWVGAKVDALRGDLARSAQVASEVAAGSRAA